MALFDLIRKENPNITEADAAYIKDNLSVSDLILLGHELHCSKEDDLRRALEELIDVEDLEPAKVTWRGISFYNLRIITDLLNNTDAIPLAHDSGESE